MLDSANASTHNVKIHLNSRMTDLCLIVKDYATVTTLGAISEGGKIWGGEKRNPRTNGTVSWSNEIKFLKMCMVSICLIKRKDETAKIANERRIITDLVETGRNKEYHDRCMSENELTRARALMQQGQSHL